MSVRKFVIGYIVVATSSSTRLATRFSNSNDNGSATEMMHKSFWFDSDLGSFLFPGYDVVSWWGLSATCSGLLSLAVVYEATRLLRFASRGITPPPAQPPTDAPGTSGNSENSSLLNRIGAVGTVETVEIVGTSSTVHRYERARWILEVIRWTARSILGYILMLAMMTYNGYVGIALVTGAALGYWIFGATSTELDLARFDRTRSRTIRCDIECADAVENPERRPSTVSNVAEELAARVSAEIHRAIDAPVSSRSTAENSAIPEEGTSKLEPEE